MAVQSRLLQYLASEGAAPVDLNSTSSATERDQVPDLHSLLYP